VNKIREVKEVKGVEDVEEMSAILDAVFVGRGLSRDTCELVFSDLGV